MLGLLVADVIRHIFMSHLKAAPKVTFTMSSAPCSNSFPPRRRALRHLVSCPLTRFRSRRPEFNGGRSPSCLLLERCLSVGPVARQTHLPVSCRYFHHIVQPPPPLGHLQHSLFTRFDCIFKLVSKADAYPRE